MDLISLLGIDHVLAGGLFVGIEMSLGFISILLNVIILATIRNSEALQGEENYILMGNMSAANIMIGTVSTVVPNSITQILFDHPFTFVFLHFIKVKIIV